MPFRDEISQLHNAHVFSKPLSENAYCNMESLSTNVHISVVTLQIFAAFKCHPRPIFLHGDGWRLSGVYFLAYNHSFVINVYWKYRLAAAAFLPSASSFGNMCDDADIRL